MKSECKKCLGHWLAMGMPAYTVHISMEYHLSDALGLRRSNMVAACAGECTGCHRVAVRELQVLASLLVKLKVFPEATYEEDMASD